MHLSGRALRDRAIWTDMVLTPGSRGWLSGLTPGPVKPLRRNLICVHGTSRSEDQYVSSEYDARAALNVGGARINLFGHTHEQVAWIAVVICAHRNQRAIACPITLSEVSYLESK